MLILPSAATTDCRLLSSKRPNYNFNGQEFNLKCENPSDFHTSRFIRVHVVVCFCCQSADSRRKRQKSLLVRLAKTDRSDRIAYLLENVGEGGRRPFRLPRLFLCLKGTLSGRRIHFSVETGHTQSSESCSYATSRYLLPVSPINYSPKYRSQGKGTPRMGRRDRAALSTEREKPDKPRGGEGRRESSVVSFFLIFPSRPPIFSD